ncbi:MAG: tRNA (adenosine(37)-N6)-dimethylallyltransferase MiaA [Candidatus Omnitrophica bacterium]|nr:tRNA (adenosine(37)-N6)-dimethylallyltransferase MiaA [Candidatus Omnitrophota bacterium]
MKPKLIFITGPTSSGKTSVAVELAERTGGEIISCDSMQVYRGMELLTRAPSRDELSRVEHHLVGMLSAEEEFSAAEFAVRAEKLVEKILESGKKPVFAGGTGLYIRSLLEGLFPSPPRDPGFRREMEALAEEKGSEYLYDMLRGTDPVSAGRLHPNDTKRIIRALEVRKLTGRTMNEKMRESRGIGDAYDCRIFVLDIPREKLYARIERSVDEMFEKGLAGEVQKLLRMDLSRTARKAIGVEEVSAYLKEEMTLEEAREEVKKNTRRYAKRQLTWFRGMDGAEWIDADRPVVEIVEEIIERQKAKG